MRPLIASTSAGHRRESPSTSRLALTTVEAFALRTLKTCPAFPSGSMERRHERPELGFLDATGPVGRGARAGTQGSLEGIGDYLVDLVST
jgi:hypothetical protein